MAMTTAGIPTPNPTAIAILSDVSSPELDDEVAAGSVVEGAVAVGIDVVWAGEESTKLQNEHCVTLVPSKPKDLPLVGTVTSPDAPVVVLACVLTGAVPAANSEV